MLKRIIFILGLALTFAAGARAQRVPIETTMIEATTKLVRAQFGRVRIFAQVSSHGTTLTWVDSASRANCLPTSTPACSNFGYNVFKGTTAGGESLTPINTALITGTTYFDPVTLTNQPQTFFYYVEATETDAGFGSVSSNPSAEVSGSFPAIPASPGGVAATPK